MCKVLPEVLKKYFIFFFSFLFFLNYVMNWRYKNVLFFCHVLWPAQKTWVKHRCSCRPLDLQRCGSRERRMNSLRCCRLGEFGKALYFLSWLHNTVSHPHLSSLTTSKIHSVFWKTKSKEQKWPPGAVNDSVNREFKSNISFFFLPALHVSSYFFSRSSTAELIV